MSSPGRGRAFWSPLVAEYEASPCAHEEFAARRGVHVATFRSWLYRLRRERMPRAAPADSSVTGPRPVAARFVELSASPTRRPCVVRVGDAEIEFAELPPAGYLADLVRAPAS